MARAPNVLESEPCFCYAGHVDAVRAICRRLFIMSPLHSCWHPNQVRTDYALWNDSAESKPIFFLVKDHPKPVPADFLAGLDAIMVEVQLTTAA